MSLPNRRSDGTFPKYSDVGCYPLFYITKKNKVLCAPCATANNAESPEDPVVTSDANWEDRHLHCDECSARIESAYADEGEEPEDEEQERAPLTN